MKTIKPITTFLFAFFMAISVMAQDKNASGALVKEGVQLHDQGKYAEAIAKYTEALKANPDNLEADFEMAYTLLASGKGKEGIPHLEKVIKANSPIAAGAYDMLGNIYDDDKQYEKAITLYKDGIKAFPQYQRLYYNLSLSLIRQQKYPEAEGYAMEAIKLDPSHASSQFCYALACSGQNKRMPALFAFCNFLILEPQTKRSGQAFTSLKNIMHAGVTKTDDKNTTINLSLPKEGDDEFGSMDLALSLAVINTDNKKSLSPTDLLQDQLSTIFKIAGEQMPKKTNKSFFWTFYADYFYKLAQSNNMAAFTHIISLSDTQEDNLKWLKDNNKALTDFQTWAKTNTRTF